MEKLGTNYGGWSIPKDIVLNNESIVYSAGVGEDMSFDILLNDKYKANIYLFDPTEKAIKHYDEFVNYYENNILFTGNIQNDYYDKIKNCNPILNQFTYIDQGLWNCESELKFYKQTNPNHVSQSLIENMFGTVYDIVKVNTIKNFMVKYNHNHIDLLKMDIEGAEIDVLENMLDDNIYPSYLCIEFDLRLKHKDHGNRTSLLIERLENCGYIILENDNWNVTFKYNN
jgi:FkbM family methyltransferase